MQKASPWFHLGRWALGLTALSTLVVIGGGTLVWEFERTAPGSNLRHWGDSLWWSMATLTTVGYGEHYPVTLGGRLVAVGIMIFGIAIIGAVAAMVAFGFAFRFARRLEAAVLHVESQQTSEIELLQSARTQAVSPASSAALEELLVTVPDTPTAASLTWLLARLGWHPASDEAGLGWAHGGTRVRLAIQPWTAPSAVGARLTFSAGRPDRLARIAREALRHGFQRVDPGSVTRAAVPISQDREHAVLRTASGFEVALVSV